MFVSLLALALQAAPAAADEALIRVRVDVTAEGKVAACEVIESNAPPKVGPATCETMIAKGRYKPATDDAGTAIASTKELRVRWRPAPPVTAVKANAKAPVGR